MLTIFVLHHYKKMLRHYIPPRNTRVIQQGWGGVSHLRSLRSAGEAWAGVLLEQWDVEDENIYNHVTVERREAFFCGV
jgi:hypothetical protein